MKLIKPVKIPLASFNFCKIAIAVIVWLAFIFKNPLFLYSAFIILASSALLKVEKAPLVWFYTNTVHKFVPSKDIYVDENGIFFAHMVGTLFTGICILLAAILKLNWAWFLVFLLCILKTSGAFGYCSALKLYSCMHSDDCCKVSKSLLRKG